MAKAKSLSKSADAAKPGKTAADRKRGVLRVFLWVGLVAAGLGFIYYLSDIFAPLLAALAVAYMLDPLVRRLEKRGWSRRKSVIVIFAAALLAMIVVVGTITPFVVRDISGSVVALTGEFDDANRNGVLDDDEKASFNDWNEDGVADPGYIVRADLWMAKSPHFHEVRKYMVENRIPERVVEWAKENAREIARTTFDFGSAGFKAILGAFSAVTWWAVNVMLFPIYLYFFLEGFGGVRDKTVEFIPSVWRPKIQKMGAEIGESVSAFFRGRLILIFILAILTAIAYAIIGLRFGVILGLLIGLTSLVPFLPLAFVVPAMVIAGLEFQTAGMVIAVLSVYLVSQFIIEPVLTPYLLGKSTGLHVVTVMVALFVWARLLGAVGLLLAVPITAALKVIARETVLPLLAEQEAPAVEGSS